MSLGTELSLFGVSMFGFLYGMAMPEWVEPVSEQMRAN